MSELGTAAGSRFVLIVTDSFTVLEYWRVQGRLREPKVGRGAEQRVAALEGYYGNSRIPVFNVYGSRFSRRILLLDVATFARLTQYKPSANDGQGTQAGHFFVRMRGLNKDDQLRQDVLDRHRAQLSGQTDPERYLRRAVLVEVFEQFSLAISDSTRGRSFSVLP